MNTFGRHEYILGNLRVPMDQISPTDWSLIIEGAIELCRPHLRRCPGYSVIKDQRKRSKTLNPGEIIIPNRVLDLDEGMTLETRFHSMAQSADLSREEDGYAGTYLLLGVHGRLFTWEYDYARTREERGARVSNKFWVNVEIARKAKFRWINGDKLSKLICNGNDFGPSFLDTLDHMFQRFQEERKKETDELVEVCSKLKGITARVS